MTLYKFSTELKNNLRKSRNDDNSIEKSIRSIMPGMTDGSGNSSRGYLDAKKIYGLPAETLRKMYDYNVVVRGVVDMIINEIVSTPYIVKHKEGNENITDKNKKDRDDILELFNKCNDNDETLTDVLERFLHDLFILDFATIEKERGEVSKKLTGLSIVDAATMRIEANEHGIISGYWQELSQDGVNPVQFYKDDIMALSLTKRSHSLYGLSKLETIHNLITAFLYCEIYNLKFFENNTIGKGILWIQNQMSESQMDRFREYWRNENKGEPHKFMVVNGGHGEMKWINLQQNQKDMEMMNYLDWLTKMIFFGFGVKPGEAGFGSQGQTPAIGQLIQSQAFKSNTLYPALRKIENMINKDIILKEFKNKDLKFEYIEEKTPQDKLQSAQIDNLRISSGVLTVDEVRKELGRKPLPPQPQQEMGQPGMIQPGMIQPGQEDQNNEGGQDNQNNVSFDAKKELEEFVNTIKDKYNKKDETESAFMKLVNQISKEVGVETKPLDKEEAFKNLKTAVSDYIEYKNNTIKIGKKVLNKKELKDKFNTLEKYIKLYLIDKKVRNL